MVNPLAIVAYQMPRTFAQYLQDTHQMTTKDWMALPETEQEKLNQDYRSEVNQETKSRHSEGEDIGKLMNTLDLEGKTLEEAKREKQLSDEAENPALRETRKGLLSRLESSSSETRG